MVKRARFWALFFCLCSCEILEWNMLFLFDSKNRAVPENHLYKADKFLTVFFLMIVLLIFNQSAWI